MHYFNIRHNLLNAVLPYVLICAALSVGYADVDEVQNTVVENRRTFIADSTSYSDGIYYDSLDNYKTLDLGLPDYNISVHPDGNRIHIEYLGDNDIIIVLKNKTSGKSDTLSPFICDYITLSYGEGEYEVLLYEKTGVIGDKYTARLIYKLDLGYISEEQSMKSCLSGQSYYANYDPYTIAELVDTLYQNSPTVEEYIENCYGLVKDSIKYDYTLMRSALEPLGPYAYRPSIERTVNTKAGICGDYASLLSSLLKAKCIPNRIIYGDAIGYHAWNEVWIDNEWRMYDAVYSVSYRDTEDFVRTIRWVHC